MEVRFVEDGVGITDQNGSVLVRDANDAKMLMRSLVHYLEDKKIETQVAQGHVTFTHQNR